VLFIWSGSPEISVRRLQASVQGQGMLAATRSAAHRTMLAREAARYAGAETSRFKIGGHLLAGKGDGKPFGVVAELLLPFHPAPDAPPGAWSETRPASSPIHAFDARGPPTLRA
jgi:hypothetical protein